MFVSMAPLVPLASRPGFPAGLEVLLIEAKEADRRESCACLQQCAYRVTSCASVAEALRLLEGKEPECAFDVVLADAPLLRGREGARLSSAAARVPLVVMASRASPHHVRSGVSLGAVDIIQKPLATQVSRTLWQHTVRRMLGYKPPAAAANAKPLQRSNTTGSGGSACNADASATSTGGGAASDASCPFAYDDSALLPQLTSQPSNCASPDHCGSMSTADTVTAVAAADYLCASDGGFLGSLASLVLVRSASEQQLMSGLMLLDEDSNDDASPLAPLSPLLQSHDSVDPIDSDHGDAAAAAAAVVVVAPTTPTHSADAPPSAAAAAIAATAATATARCTVADGAVMGHAAGAPLPPLPSGLGNVAWGIPVMPLLIRPRTAPPQLPPFVPGGAATASGPCPWDVPGAPLPAGMVPVGAGPAGAAANWCPSPSGWPSAAAAGPALCFTAANILGSSSLAELAAAPSPLGLRLACSASLVDFANACLA